MFEAYGPLLYEIGLADENQLDHITTEAKGVHYIAAGLYYEAFLVTMPFPVNQTSASVLVTGHFTDINLWRVDWKTAFL